MSKTIDLRDFARLVRKALVDLYDYPCLQVSPLADLLAADQPTNVRGAALHHLLLQSIESLKPTSTDADHPALRRYQYLYLRYVDVRSLADIAAMLGVGFRQARRYHHEALDALASRLYECHVMPSATMSIGWPGSFSPAPTLAAEAERIEAAGRTRPTNIGEVLASVVETLAPLGGSGRSALDIVCPPDLPSIAAERSLARQILIHATHTALSMSGGIPIDIIGEGEVGQVTIHLRLRSGGGDWTSSEVVSRLAVCRSLSTLVHGEFAVRRTSRGVQISVSFPTALATTVLVIDDNPDVRQLFRRYLTGDAYDVIEASGFEDGLVGVREFSPDVITLDVMLPGHDGWELLQRIKHDSVSAEIPVIVCSVLGERDLAFALGASEFLDKPATPGALIGAIARCRERCRDSRLPQAAPGDRSSFRER